MRSPTVYSSGLSQHWDIERSDSGSAEEHTQCSDPNFDLRTRDKDTISRPDLFEEHSEITGHSSLDELLSFPSAHPSLYSRNVSHSIQGIYSPLHRCTWKEMLLYGDGDPDALFLLDGVTTGFKLVNPAANVQGYFSSNYYSASVSSKEEVDEIIQSELSQGKFTITSEKPVCVHAIGGVPKSSGGIRNITDCSRPKGLSINNHMKQTFSSFKYKSMDDVTSKLAYGSFMAITDISSAYRAVPIPPADRVYQGLSWQTDGEEVFLIDNFLSFGTRVAPFIFSRLSDAIARHLEALGIKCVNYLDDFIVIGDDWESCRQAQLSLHALLRNLGFHIAYKKVVSPATKVTYLGVEIDTLDMELQLPMRKLDKLHTELAFFKGRHRATLRQIQRLSGILSHCATLVKGGRTFSHRVISLLKCFRPGKRYVTLSGSFHQDLEWWTQFVQWFNGGAKMIDKSASYYHTLECDASFHGYGAVCDSDWLAGSWSDKWYSPHDHHGHLIPTVPPISKGNINVLELFPIYVSLLRWGNLWRNKKIKCKSDNTQVCWVINKGCSSNEVSMALLRKIFWLTVIYNCHLVAEHISGESNSVPDFLSRLSDPAMIDSSLPDYLCCYRSASLMRGIGSEGRGSTPTRASSDFLEDPVLSMELIYQIL